MQHGSVHQGKLQGTKQSGSQQQGKPQGAAVTRSNDQVATAESELGSKELMDLIEAVPHYDQIIHSIQEIMLHGLGS